MKKTERKVLQDTDRIDVSQIRSESNNSFLNILYFFNLIAVLSLIIFSFIKNILPLEQRLLYTGGIVAAQILILVIINRRQGKGLKTISSLLMIVSIIFSIGFIFYFVRLDNAIARINENSQISSISNDEDEDSSNRIVDGESFNVYISGLDTYGELDGNSRSDVNIIATINTSTGNVLLTNIPRDTYLPIAGRGNLQYDKLTHSGNYGIKSSMNTVERFLDIEIPYYVRVNFDSVIQIVDALGGITVENEREFTAGLSGNTYPQGSIYLDGEHTLDFVRERYSLEDGDQSRGRNQERVLEAIISKMLSPSILFNFSEILEALDKNVQTNMSTNRIMDLVNKQMFTNQKFDIESQDIDGEGRFDLPSYAMPDHELYMLVPYDYSVQNSIDKINEVLTTE